MHQKAIADIYHQETKYTEQKMSQYTRPLNWETQPLPYKQYHSEKKIDLVSYLPFQNNPFTGKPLLLPKETEATTRQEIARLLYFTNGVTGIVQYNTGQSLYLRAAPTAGGLYPTETYIAIRNDPSFEDGVYNFHVNGHSVVPIWEGNFWKEFEKYCLYHEAIAQSNLLMIMTAIYQRSAWRYQERAYRRILLDTGHIIGNAFAYAQEEGWNPYLIGGFFDAEINRLLFLDESQEGVLAIVAFPKASATHVEAIHETSAYPSSSKISQGHDPSLQLTLHYVSSILADDPLSPPEQPLSTNPAMYSDQGLGSHHTVKEVIALHPNPISWEMGIGRTILKRRSTRTYTGGPFSMGETSAILEYAYRPITTRPSSFFVPHLLETYVIIQKMVDLKEGIFHYDPTKHHLEKLCVGDFREQTWHFCLSQELARDAAVVVIHIAHLKTALEQYGDRVYRYLHMDAGHIGQRINLAAIHLGLGVSGIGGFYDDEVNETLGLSLDWIIVYITTLGKPAHP